LIAGRCFRADLQSWLSGAAARAASALILLDFPNENESEAHFVPRSASRGI
jgi:hypothetical protein